MKVAISTIQQAYVRLWLAFTDAAGKQALGAESVGNGAIVTKQNGLVTATAVLFLPGWPYKSVSDRRVVDIAINVIEIFSDDLSSVTKATTQIGYFLRDTNTDPPKARPILEMHYDFETPSQEAHPMFHAQIGTTKWDEKKLQQLGMKALIERDPTEKHYANTRIPTAYVGFGTILVALAADHLKPRNFRSMIKAAREPDGGNVNPACRLLLDSMIDAESVHAHHWYDERYVVHLWKDSQSKKFKAAVPVLDEEYTDADEKKLKGTVVGKLGVRLSQIRFVNEAPTSAQAHR